MTVSILIIVGLIGIIFFLVFFIKKNYDSKKQLEKKYNKIIGDNRKLNSALIKISHIEKERIKENEKINKTPDNRVADMLNGILHND